MYGELCCIDTYNSTTRKCVTGVSLQCYITLTARITHFLTALIVNTELVEICSEE